MGEKDNKHSPTIEERISEMAELQFTDAEIALILQIPVTQLVKHNRADIDRGRLLADAEVRRSILQLAKQGSTPAQKEFIAMNRRAKK